MAPYLLLHVYGQIASVQKTLDSRKHCTRELFSVVLTKISHKKTLKAVSVSCCQIILFLKENLCKSAFAFEPEGVGLGKVEEGCHV